MYSEFLKCSSIKGQHSSSKQIQSVLNEQLDKNKFSYITLSAVSVYSLFQLFSFIEKDLKYSRYSHNIVLLAVAITELFV